MLRLFDNLMANVSRESTPLHVEGDIQYLVNRNKNGWIVSLFNNYGVSKPRGAPPKLNTSKTRNVCISKSGRVKTVYEWITQKNLKTHSGKKGITVNIKVPPGDVRIVEFRE